MPQSVHLWLFDQWQNEDNKTYKWLWPIRVQDDKLSMLPNNVWISIPSVLQELCFFLFSFCFILKSKYYIKQVDILAKVWYRWLLYICNVFYYLINMSISNLFLWYITILNFGTGTGNEMERWDLKLKHQSPHFPIHWNQTNSRFGLSNFGTHYQCKGFKKIFLNLYNWQSKIIYQ